MSFLRFCAVGVLNPLVGLPSFFALMRFGGVQYVVANAVGYAVGITISFLLNRSWTFYHKGPLLRSAARWTLVVAIAYAANAFVLIVSHGIFWN